MSKKNQSDGLGQIKDRFDEYCCRADFARQVRPIFWSLLETVENRPLEIYLPYFFALISALSTYILRNIATNIGLNNPNM
mgnify:CR=1 FL=1